MGKARAEDAEDRAAVDREEDLGERADLADLVAELAVLGDLLEAGGEAGAECLAGAEG